MKKLFYLLSMMFIINTSYGSIDSVITEAKQTVKETINTVDTSSTFKQIYSDVKEGIAGLASALKVGAEHVYGVLVMQQVVNSVIYVVLGIIGLILIINWFKAYKSDETWMFPPKSNYSDPSEGTPKVIGVVRMLQLVAGIILNLMFLVYMDVIVMGIVNPEYGAIMEIIKFAK